MPEAEVQRALTDAINLLSDAQSALKYRLALLAALPAVIQQSVEPMKSIDGIKIVQVDGLNRGGGNGAGSGATAAGGAPGAAGGQGNLAESVIAAALAYRAHAPIIDSLLSEVGLEFEFARWAHARHRGSAGTDYRQTDRRPAAFRQPARLDDEFGGLRL